MKHMFKFPKKLKEAILVMIGVVLVWRGLWLILDSIDIYIFGGTHLITGIIGTILGFTILYYLDDELEGLSRL
jgi:hypothetical protein